MAEGDNDGRVVLGHKEDTFAGFTWTGAEPEGLSRPGGGRGVRRDVGGYELVTYNLDALTGEFQRASEEQYLEDDDWPELSS